MIELPESYTISKQINETITGKQIASVIVEQNSHRFAFYSQFKDLYDQMLIGQTITGATYRGGLIEIDTENFFLYFGDGAYPRFNQCEIPQKHQLLIVFTDSTNISVSVQMYGSLRLFPMGDCEDAYYISSCKKKNLLDKDFTFEYFKGLYDSNRTLSVKAFLATEQRIAGLGNGVLQDILYNCGLDPRCSMKSLNEQAFKSLYESCIETNRQMCDKGGRNTEKDFFGNKGGYMPKLCKETVGSPCKVCGNIIDKANYMGGTIYFCDHCQRR